MKREKIVKSSMKVKPVKSSQMGVEDDTPPWNEGVASITKRAVTDVKSRMPKEQFNVPHVPEKNEKKGPSILDIILGNGGQQQQQQ